MPKIRGVKPDFWTDEDIMDLSIPARLLFIGLWNYACDNGHLQDKPKQIKMRLLPADDVNVAELLRELAANGRIRREDGWITIPNFVTHQKPDKRYWQTCDLPDCTRPDGDSQRETRSGPHVGTTSAQRGPSVGSQSALGDGDGDGDGDGERKGARKRRATQLPADFAPKDEHRRLAAELGLNLQFEFAKFRDYWVGEGKPKADWDATLRNWLRNSRSARTPQPALAVITDSAGKVDESALPPVADSWMKRRPR